MTPLHDRDLARAFGHGSHTYDRLTVLDPGHRTDLPRTAWRISPFRAGACPRVLDPGCGARAPRRPLWRGAVGFGALPVFTGVRATPVAGRRTGTMHTFLARSGVAAAAGYTW